MKKTAFGKGKRASLVLALALAAFLPAHLGDGTTARRTAPVQIRP